MSRRFDDSSSNNTSPHVLNAFRSPSMPPYSTDPQLSLTRHADPEYENSSDTIADLYASSEHMSDTLIPSSPPKFDAFGVHKMEVDDDDAPTDEDATDDDMADENGANTTLHQSTNLAHERNSTVKYTSSYGVPAGRSTSHPASSFILAARSESSFGRRAPESIVSSVFDNDKVTDLMFDNMDLERVPDVVRDLVDHTDLANRLFKMNFSYNCLLRLDQSVYQITRLEFLDLRANRLSELSALIGELVNLRELHLGHNQLKTLPVELLTLPKLKILTTYPNKFIAKPEEMITQNGSDLSKLFVVNPTISLQELSRRSILNFLRGMTHTEVDYTLREIHTVYQQLIVPTAQAVEIGRVCSVCKQPLVEPVAYHLRWTKHGEDRSGETIPFQTLYCSGSCFSAP